MAFAIFPTTLRFVSTLWHFPQNIPVLLLKVEMKKAKPRGMFDL